MIFGILASRSVRLSDIARYFIGNANAESCQKRMYRLLANTKLPEAMIARLNLAIVGLTDNKLTLIFDRTNWKFGKTHINLLCLCIVNDGVMVPLLTLNLEGKKQGNSDFFDRMKLLERFIEYFGQDRIKVVLGDREFVGKCWVLWLQAKNIPFVMRLPERGTHISLDGEHFAPVSKLIKVRKSISLGPCLIGKTDGYQAHLSVKRLSDGGHLLVMHSKGIEKPLEAYRERWKVETMFRMLKSGGFNLEDTKITDPSRLHKLVTVLSVAFSIAITAGLLVIKLRKPKAKNHGYRPKSIIRMGLDAIFAVLYAPIKHWDKSHKGAIFRPLEIFVR
jgi:hypothetical protein